MFGAIQDLYPDVPYLRSADTPPSPMIPGLGPLEQAITQNLKNELYRRGYGSERFGNLSEGSNLLWVLLGAIGIVWLWTS